MVSKYLFVVRVVRLQHHLMVLHLVTRLGKTTFLHHKRYKSRQRTNKHTDGSRPEPTETTTFPFPFFRGCITLREYISGSVPRFPYCEQDCDFSWDVSVRSKCLSYEWIRYYLCHTPVDFFNRDLWYGSPVLNAPRSRTYKYTLPDRR